MTNLLCIRASVAPGDVKAKNKAAFQRSTVIDAGQIQVETRDGQVILRGRVPESNHMPAAHRLLRCQYGRGSRTARGG